MTGHALAFCDNVKTAVFHPRILCILQTAAVEAGRNG